MIWRTLISGCVAGAYVFGKTNEQEVEGTRKEGSSLASGPAPQLNERCLVAAAIERVQADAFSYCRAALNI